LRIKEIFSGIVLIVVIRLNMRLLLVIMSVMITFRA